MLAVTTHAHTQTCTQTELDAKRDRILELEAAATRAESALHEAKSASQVALMEARQQLVEDWSVRLTEASSKLQERLSQREQEIASMQVRVTAVTCHGVAGSVRLGGGARSWAACVGASYPGGSCALQCGALRAAAARGTSVAHPDPPAVPLCLPAGGTRR